MDEFAQGEEAERDELQTVQDQCAETEILLHSYDLCQIDNLRKQLTESETDNATVRQEIADCNNQMLSEQQEIFSALATHSDSVAAQTRALKHHTHLANLKTYSLLLAR